LESGTGGVDCRRRRNKDEHKIRKGKPSADIDPLEGKGKNDVYR